MNPLLELDGIGKSFFGAPALSDVSISVMRGTLLGLVGQNGAGKSTLMNVIGGVVLPDTGEMRIAGKPYAPRGPRDAERAGIAFIHQELNLFTNLSIAENIFIADFPKSGRLIDRRMMRSRAADLLARVGLDLSPDLAVERLSPGERQLVEVAKALELDAQIVIFDEPTTSLTARETGRLFELIGRLRSDGKTIIYISHILPDVQALADEIGVLRDGRLVATGPRGQFPVSRMINLMIGRDIEQLYPERPAAQPGEVLLEVRNLSANGVVRSIDLQLRRGEVVGLFGLMGSGRTEFCRMLFGLDRFDSGEIHLGGQRLTRLSPRTAIGARMAFLTENRREEGLMMSAPVSSNIVLAALPKLGNRLGLIDETRLTASAGDLIAALNIGTGRSGAHPVKTLSGGNQQKAVIAKWLMADPAILIFDEPTRGIDVAAKLEIYRMIDRLAGNGCAVLLVSSEIEEAMAMSDRLLVMSRGEIVGEFTRATMAKDAILRAAFRELEPVV